MIKFVWIKFTRLCEDLFWVISSRQVFEGQDFPHASLTWVPKITSVKKFHLRLPVIFFLCTFFLLSCSVTFELWLEIQVSLSSCFLLFSVFALRFSDYIRGMLKLILVLMFAGASLAATWFTLTCLTRLTHLPSTKGILCWKGQYVLPCAHPQNCRPAGSLVGERWHRQAAIVSVRGSQRNSLSPDQWREKWVGL